VAGFDNDYLAIIAGKYEPFNQFEMTELFEKAFKELHLDYSDKERIVKNYCCFLIDKALSQPMELFNTLKILNMLCLDMDFPNYLNDLYLLCFAKEDFLHNEQYTHYWNGATPENIDLIITDYFQNWMKINCNENTKFSLP
jgi:hypothetical protein